MRNLFNKLVLLASDPARGPASAASQSSRAIRPIRDNSSADDKDVESCFN